MRGDAAHQPHTSAIRHPSTTCAPAPVRAGRLACPPSAAWMAPRRARAAAALLHRSRAVPDDSGGPQGVVAPSPPKTKLDWLVFGSVLASCGVLTGTLLDGIHSKDALQARTGVAARHQHVAHPACATSNNRSTTSGRWTPAACTRPWPCRPSSRFSTWSWAAWCHWRTSCPRAQPRTR